MVVSLGDQYGISVHGRILNNRLPEATPWIEDSTRCVIATFSNRSEINVFGEIGHMAILRQRGPRDRWLDRLGDGYLRSLLWDRRSRQSQIMSDNSPKGALWIED